MSIVPGTRLGRYEIRSKIGEGGMGEVYRARDEKLNRDVAIKVLPATFSENGDRLHRFEQEAQAAGTLNHPNILAVYDVGSHQNSPYIVSELLEGQSLKDYLDDGPVAQRKAIDYALQAAHGLAAAHEKGIIHRDLKPDNLFVTNDDRIKILDFGIAKLAAPNEQGLPQTEIATRKVHTDPGTVIGTVGYMSPKQVRGKHVDHRSDIFSLGAVFYEMLSGRRAFHGDSAVETLNAILKEEPPELVTTNRNVPPALERVVWHCLEKSPDRRFQSASDVAFALESLSGVTTQSSQETLISAPARGRMLTHERLIWLGVCAGLLALSAAHFLAYFSSRRTTNRRPVRLALALPPQASSPSRITVSPDGGRVVFVANTTDGKRLLWVRSLDSLNAQPLQGTEGASSPFWSPDSRFVGFFANRKLLRIDPSGGRPQALCDVAEDRGGAWSPDGTIVFGGQEGGLSRVSAQGGTPTPATKIDAKEEAHRWPYFLPDGKHFVFLGDAATAVDHHIRVGSLDSQDTQILFGAISRIVYAPSGYLLYVNQGALVARPFDASSLKVTADATTIVEHVAEIGPNHEFDFSVSEEGVLAYHSGNPTSQLTWFDREGKKLNAVGEPTNISTVRLSPDGRRAAIEQLDPDGRLADVWVLDLERNSISRLTFDLGGDGSPVWSPDGSRIVFASNRLGNGQINLYLKPASGAGEDQLLFQSDGEKFCTSWSRDGQNIFFENWIPKSKAGVWVFSMSDRQAKPVLETNSFDQFSPKISPDGHFLAYCSNESGRPEVYVQPFPVSGDKWKISSDGGGLPIWRADGKELFFLAEGGKLMSAEIRTEGKFDSGVPRQLFQTNIKYHGDFSYAAQADGQRFLVNSLLDADSATPLTVVLNWNANLK